MIKVLRELLVQAISDIDAGNSKISESACLKLIDIYSDVVNLDEKLSKYQSINFLQKHGINIKRATFDNYVREGKIPQGRHQQGFKEIFWLKKDLLECIDKIKNS